MSGMSNRDFRDFAANDKEFLDACDALKKELALRAMQSKTAALKSIQEWYNQEKAKLNAQKPLEPADKTDKTAKGIYDQEKAKFDEAVNGLTREFEARQKPILDVYNVAINHANKFQVSPTPRQASKFRNKKGSAYKWNHEAARLRVERGE